MCVAGLGEGLLSLSCSRAACDAAAGLREGLLSLLWSHAVHALLTSYHPAAVCDRDIVPVGKVRGNFNFSLDDKRVLNMENVVTDDDNIKQVTERQ